MYNDVAVNRRIFEAKNIAIFQKAGIFIMLNSRFSCVCNAVHHLFRG